MKHVHDRESPYLQSARKIRIPKRGSVQIQHYLKFKKGE